MKCKNLLAIALFPAILASCGVVDDSGDDKEVSNEIFTCVLDDYDQGKVDALKKETNLGPSIYQANRIKNKVQAAYTSDDRYYYTVKNSTMQFTHRCTTNTEESGSSSSKVVTSFKNSRGKDYFINSLDSYIRYEDDYVYAKNYEGSARINTTKLGYYYYEVNVRDYDFSDLGYDVMFEKKFHTFSDQLRPEFRFVAQSKVKLDAIGMDLNLLNETLEHVYYYDGQGQHEFEEGKVTINNAVWVAFDVKEAGIFGFILDNENTITLSKTERLTNFKQEVVKEDRSLKSGEDMRVYNRLYNDETHSLDGIKAAAAIERAPLTSSNITVENVDGAKFGSYNFARGTYDFDIDGMGFYESFYQHPEKKFYENIKVNCPDDRSVYFYVHSTYPLEGSVLVQDQKLMPLPLEVCKNFGHENEEPIYEKGDPMYGDVIFPLVLEKNFEYDFSIVNVMQKWGNYKLKQISSISYYISYYHMSTGVTETNCIAPYFSLNANYGRFNYGWFIPDFRGPSGERWSLDPQFNSVGIVTCPTNGSGSVLANYQSSNIVSSGLTHADLSYSYVSADDLYKFTFRHVEMPQDDESRTYYQVEIEMLQDATLKSKDFSFFGFDGRNSSYSNYAYLDENNTHQVIAAKKEVGAETFNKLHDGSSYLSVYNIDNKSVENNNFGLIVKNATCQSESKSDFGLAFYTNFGKIHKNYNYASLTLNKDLSLKKGDKMNLDVILLPFGDQGKMTEKGDNVIKVYNDSVLNELNLSPIVGKGVKDTYIPTIQAKDNVAEFQVAGGSYMNNKVTYSLKVKGLNKIAHPNIQKMGENDYEEYNYSSEILFDGYSISYEKDGTFTYSFNITKGNGVDQYKFSL